MTCSCFFGRYCDDTMTTVGVQPRKSEREKQSTLHSPENEIIIVLLKPPKNILYFPLFYFVQDHTMFIISDFLLVRYSPLQTSYMFENFGLF
jgi:hypothetical protein